MMTGPIPPRANAGSCGLLVVFVAGVVLLPMGRAERTYPSPSASSAPKGSEAALPDGVAVEFTGVSPRPGRKTAVAIGVTAAEYELQSPAPVQAPGVEAVARLLSARSLARLGRALQLYAHDHQNKLPEALADMEEYLTGADASWLKDNVEYLHGRTLADRPDVIVAYDRTLLAKNAGTNVLYLDSRVAFETPSLLRTLGIGGVDGALPVPGPPLKSEDGFRVYNINRSVAEYAPGEDLSTPDAAYATINRMPQDDPSAWQKVSIVALAERFAREGRPRRTTTDPEWTRMLRHARIRDVIIWKDTQAIVVAELPQGYSSRQIFASVDARYFQREDGRWLNAGNNRFVTVEQAETDFIARFVRSQGKTDAYGNTPSPSQPYASGVSMGSELE